MHMEFCKFRSSLNKWMELWRSPLGESIPPPHDRSFQLFAWTRWQFFQGCANIIWGMKGPKGPHFSILFTFFRGKVFNSIPKVKGFYSYKSSNSHGTGSFSSSTTYRPLPNYYLRGGCDRIGSDRTWSLLSFYSVNIVFVLGFRC
jgi:hypothetical protein